MPEWFTLGKHRLVQEEDGCWIRPCGFHICSSHLPATHPPPPPPQNSVINRGHAVKVTKKKNNDLKFISIATYVYPRSASKVKCSGFLIYLRLFFVTISPAWLLWLPTSSPLNPTTRVKCLHLTRTRIYHIFLTLMLLQMYLFLHTTCVCNCWRSVARFIIARYMLIHHSFCEVKDLCIRSVCLSLIKMRFMSR